MSNWMQDSPEEQVNGYGAKNVAQQLEALQRAAMQLAMTGQVEVAIDHDLEPDPSNTKPWVVHRARKTTLTVAWNPQGMVNGRASARG